MKILIADDELANRMVMREFLGAWGQCDLVENGEEAVEAFELSASEGQPYDLICMDLFMPIMNGDEALQAIRILEKELGVPPQFETFVCMITGMEQSETATNLYYQGGSTATLVKPINREQLYVKLEEHGFIRPMELRSKVSLAPVHPITDELARIPGLDIPSGMERVMGNMELYRELVLDFLKDHGNDVEKIQKAMDSNHQDVAVRLVHSIKGTAGNISALPVQAAAKALENALRHNAPPEECKACLQEFNAAMSAFLPAVQEVLVSQPR
ncbi:MAG: response regulator [Magnetococcales bacterium]|nr:response regulator [Magnetococcales bacterium]